MKRPRPPWPSIPSHDPEVLIWQCQFEPELAFSPFLSFFTNVNLPVDDLHGVIDDFSVVQPGGGWREMIYLAQAQLPGSSGTAFGIFIFELRIHFPGRTMGSRLTFGYAFHRGNVNSRKSKARPLRVQCDCGSRSHCVPIAHIGTGSYPML